MVPGRAAAASSPLPVPAPPRRASSPPDPPPPGFRSRAGTPRAPPLGMRVDPAHARGAVGPLVVDDAVHDRVGDDTELAGLPRGRQRGAQAREVASVAAAARALVTRLAGAAAVVRSGQVGNTRHRHAPPAEHPLDSPLHQPLGTVHFPRREELPLPQMPEAEAPAAHPHEPLHVRLPPRPILVTDPPNHPPGLAAACLRIEDAPRPAQPTP